MLRQRRVEYSDRSAKKTNQPNHQQWKTPKEDRNPWRKGEREREEEVCKGRDASDTRMAGMNVFGRIGARAPR